MGIRNLGLLAALICVISLAACESIQVNKVKHSVPVAFATYAWGTSALIDVADASAQLVELDSDLRSSVNRLMQSRGYRQASSVARADMVLDYQVAIVEEQFAGGENSSSWEAQFDSNTPVDAVDLPARSAAPRVTLTLGLARKDGPVLWGGSATKLITRPEDQRERQRIVDAAVSALLRDLPPAS